MVIYLCTVFFDAQCFIHKFSCLNKLEMLAHISTQKVRLNRQSNSIRKDLLPQNNLTKNEKICCKKSIHLM